MNLFRSQLQRNAVPTALLALLLAVALAFSAVSASAWSAAQVQLKMVNGRYTTVAIPRFDSAWTTLLYEDNDRIPLESQENRDYPGLITEDCKGFLAAHVAGCEPVSSYELDDFSSAYFDFLSKALAVMAVRCTHVEESELFFETNGSRSYVAEFAVEDVVFQFSSYETALPEPTNEILLWNALYLEDGQIPFEMGKRYLLFGLYGRPLGALKMPGWGRDGSMWTFPDAGRRPCDLSYIDMNPISISDDSDAFLRTNGLFSWRERDDGDRIFYPCLAEDSLPFSAEYAGDWRDFLSSEAGRVWREEIIPLCQLNYESAGVVLANDINGIYMFNSGIGSIIEGRSFTAEEYAGGEAMCLVSAAYAEKNGLTVGDEINLDLYQATLGYTYDSNESNQDLENMKAALTEPVCLPGKRIGVQKDYTVVGIYSAPEFSFGLHSFHANTVFIPKASVPNAGKYVDPLNAALYSIILENGREDEFEEYLASLGYGGLFEYFDQEYNQLADTYAVISANALRLLLISGAAFILAGALFLLLSLRRLGSTARSMRLLGVKSGQVWRELVKALGALILISAGAGGVLGAALYGAVMERVLSSSVALRPGVLALCTVIPAALLLAAAALCALPVARRSPMRSERRRK